MLSSRSFERLISYLCWLVLIENTADVLEKVLVLAIKFIMKTMIKGS